MAEKPCKLWTRATSSNGYGRRGRNGVVGYVHRQTWEDTYGEIPPGLEVCHTCDVRNCYEISHLFLGTRKQNAEDCVAKNRPARGNKLPHTILTETDVKIIRRMYSSGESQSDLAEFFGVHYNTINSIILRKNWKYL